MDGFDRKHSKSLFHAKVLICETQVFGQTTMRRLLLWSHTPIQKRCCRDANNNFALPTLRA